MNSGIAKRYCKVVLFCAPVPVSFVRIPTAFVNLVFHVVQYHSCLLRLLKSHVIPLSSVFS